MMNNTMLDLETWGIVPGCAIRSIGAVMFDPISGGIGKEFYMNIDEATCTGVGLTKSEDTIKYWAEQRPEAQSVLLPDQFPLEEVLDCFVQWFQRSQGIFVWSQGANFDEPIIQAAMRACAIEAPWKFWNVRDTRTAYEMARFNHFKVKRNGIAHYALDDAKHQVKCLQASYANLYNGRAV